MTDFEELRTRLAALGDSSKTAERKLRALQSRTEHLTQLECDRDSLLESYAGLLPEAINALGSEERHHAKESAPRRAKKAIKEFEGEFGTKWSKAAVATKIVQDEEALLAY